MSIDEMMKISNEIFPSRLLLIHGHEVMAFGIAVMDAEREAWAKVCVTAVTAHITPKPKAWLLTNIYLGHKTSVFLDEENAKSWQKANGGYLQPLFSLADDVDMILDELIRG